MSKRSVIVPWIFIVFLSMPWPATVQAADPVQEGIQAFQRHDFATALRLFRPLADRGNATAQWSLGYMYYEGLAVPRNYTAAAKWYEKAAGQGLPAAQYNLGLMYRDGLGVPRDYVTAHMWMNRAVSGLTGEPRMRAIQFRDQLAAEIAKAPGTPARKEEASRPQPGGDPAPSGNLPFYFGLSATLGIFSVIIYYFRRRRAAAKKREQKARAEVEKEEYLRRRREREEREAREKMIKQLEEQERLARERGVREQLEQEEKARQKRERERANQEREQTNRDNGSRADTGKSPISIEDYYAILEVEPSATFKEIKAAYLLRMSEYHPDKVAHLGRELRQVAEDKARKINEAYAFLKKAKGA